jgi:hypothetical protein
MSRLLLVLAVVLAAIPGGVLSSPSQQSPTVDQVEKAWKARQERFRTVQVVWEQTNLITKGSLSQGLPPPVLKEFGPDPVPREDFTYVSNHAMILEGDSYRYSDRTQVYSAPNKDYIWSQFVMVYDGEILSIKRKYEGAPMSGGEIQKPQNAIHVKQVSFYPIIMSFRPMNPKLRGFDIRDFSPTGASEMMAGHRCWEFAKRLRPQVPRQSIWIDPAMDYQVCRMSIDAKKSTREQAECRYEKNEKHGWLLKSWKTDIINTMQGAVIRSWRGEVKHVECNATLNPKTFVLEAAREDR